MNNKPFTEIESAPPVFFKAADGPFGLTVEEIALAAEQKIGDNRIAGAVKKGNLWRLHARTLDDRTKLLNGDCRIVIKRKSQETGRIKSFYIPLSSKNPLAYLDPITGEQLETTRLSIDGFLLSVTAADIKHSLEESIPDLKLTTNIFYDRAFKSDGKLSKWVNGKRFAYMVVPKEELPLTIKVGNFKAYLNYKERPKRAISCWDCKLEGHKRGDPKCPNPVKVWSTGEPKSTDKTAAPRPEALNSQAEALLETLKSMRSPELGETPNEGKRDLPRARRESLSGSVNSDVSRLDSSESVLGDDDKGPQWEDSSSSSEEKDSEDDMEDEEEMEDDDGQAVVEGEVDDEREANIDVEDGDSEKDDDGVKEDEEILDNKNQSNYDNSERIYENAESAGGLIYRPEGSEKVNSEQKQNPGGNDSSVTENETDENLLDFSQNGINAMAFDRTQSVKTYASTLKSVGLVDNSTHEVAQKSISFKDKLLNQARKITGQNNYFDIFNTPGSQSRKRDQDNKFTSPPQDVAPAARRGPFKSGDGQA